ncbi:hypothetical protein RCL1_001572 [Eukaryota sp. TZLM3-RCL]
MPPRPNPSIDAYIARQAAMKERARKIREERASTSAPSIVDDRPVVVTKKEPEWDGTLYPPEGPFIPSKPSTRPKPKPTTSSSHTSSEKDSPSDISHYYYNSNERSDVTTNKRISRTTLSSSLQLLKSLQSNDSPVASKQPSRPTAPSTSRLPTRTSNDAPKPSRPAASARKHTTSAAELLNPIDDIPVGSSPKPSIPEESYGGEDMVPCKICGRSFAASRVSKHEGICAKQSSKGPRKAFDPTKQRLPPEALEVQTTTKKGVGSRAPARGTERAIPVKSTTRPNWREQRAQLQAALRAGKPGQSGALEAPQPVDNRVECKYCGRKFNDDRIEKHVSVCAKQAANMKNTSKTGVRRR